MGGCIDDFESSDSSPNYSHSEIISDIEQEISDAIKYNNQKQTNGIKEQMQQEQSIQFEQADGNQDSGILFTDENKFQQSGNDQPTEEFQPLSWDQIFKANNDKCMRWDLPEQDSEVEDVMEDEVNDL